MAAKFILSHVDLIEYHVACRGGCGARVVANARQVNHCEGSVNGCDPKDLDHLAGYKASEMLK